MKVILKIGSAEFIASSAEAAARVADELGKMSPMDSEYISRIQDYVVCLEPNYKHAHKIEISSMDGLRVFKDRAALKVFQDEAPTEAQAVEAPAQPAF